MRLAAGGTLALAALALAGCATGGVPAAQVGGVARELPSEVVVDIPDQTFICPSGALAEVRRDAPAGVAIVTYMDETTTFMQEVGKSPASFVAGSSSLVLEPTRVVLRRGREKALACELRPEAPQRGVLWGTISKMDRMALVPGTRAKVIVGDVSRAGAPMIEVASTQLETMGNQVPLHFLIRYDESRILPGMRYSIMARIEDPKGRLLYITDTFNPVFETVGKAQPPVDLMLIRVPGNQ
ncbi:MAG: YbaY family lipoprotein [Thermaurantiacus sp.]